MDYLALTGSELNTVSGSIQLKFANQSLGAIVSAALPYFFGIAGFALAVYIVFSGFSVLTSKGDERALAAAKAKLTYAIIGFLLVFSAYWIVQIVGVVLKVQVINTMF
jgi:hypothetical protein